MDFSEIAKEELVRAGIGTQCIAACRIAVDLLTRAGFSARPLSVKVLILNSKYKQQVAELRGFPSREEYWPGAYSSGIGFGEPELFEWSGHLVVIVENHTLLDLTLNQAARPEYDVHLPSFLVWEVNRKFLRGDFIVELSVGDTTMTYVTYKAYPSDKTYNVTPLWKDRKITERVANRIAERLSRLAQS